MSVLWDTMDTMGLVFAPTQLEPGHLGRPPSGISSD